MSVILDNILAWAERRLPGERQSWISDLRVEAEHIPAGRLRMGFQWSGIIAAASSLLRIKYGPQKIGQFLLATALIMFSLAVLTSAVGIEDKFAQTAFYFAVPLYAFAASLAVTDLRLMKRYTVGFSLGFAVLWAALGLEFITLNDAPDAFLRAFTLEASFIMAGLFIAASYLGWVGDVDTAEF